MRRAIMIAGCVLTVAVMGTHIGFGSRESDSFWLSDFWITVSFAAMAVGIAMMLLAGFDARKKTRCSCK